MASRVTSCPRITVRLDSFLRKDGGSEEGIEDSGSQQGPQESHHPTLGGALLLTSEFNGRLAVVAPYAVGHFALVLADV